MIIQFITLTLFNHPRHTLSLISPLNDNLLLKRFYPGGPGRDVGHAKKFFNAILHPTVNQINIVIPRHNVTQVQALVALNTIRNNSLINARSKIIVNYYRNQLKRQAMLAEEYKTILYVDPNGVIRRDMFQLHYEIGGGAILDNQQTDLIILDIQDKIKKKSAAELGLPQNLHHEKQVAYAQERDLIILNSIKFIQEYGMKAFSQSEHAHNLLAFISKSRPNGVLISDNEAEFFKQIQTFYETHKAQDNSNEKLNNENQRTKICYTPEDFINEKTRLQENIIKLSTPTIEKEILIKFALQSPILVKEEGILKLTQKAYELIRTNNKLLGVQTIDERPDKEDILKLIQEKKWDVLAATDQIPKGDIISTGPLLHKIVVITPTSGKKLIIALFTSAQDDNVIKLANTQETNPDPEEQKKRQNFRVLQSFILAESNEPAIMPLRNLDPETTRFSKGINKEGEDVAELILDHFRKTADVWSNNDIQKYFNITLETLHKLILLAYQDSLKEVDRQEQAFEEKLRELAKKEQGGDKKYIAKMNKRKEDAAKAFEENKMLNQTPVNITLMKKISKIINRLQQEEATLITKAKDKEAKEKAMEKRRTAEEEKLRNPKPLTPKERRLELQKKKELEKEENDKKGN